MGSERLHLSDGGQSDRLVFGDLAVLDDIEDGVTAKPAAFAFVATLALCAVVKPGSDKVGVRFPHVASVYAANKRG